MGREIDDAAPFPNEMPKVNSVLLFAGPYNLLYSVTPNARR